jgi:hypothetical protein
MDQFRGEKRTAAVLTLTGLIQEQNRWEDSLTVLTADDQAKRSTLGHMYLHTALVGLRRMLPSEFLETMALMRQVVTTRPADVRAALCAVELAVLIYSQAYDDALLPELMGILREAEDIDWPIEERATIALAKLQLQFNAGMTRYEREAAAQQLEELVDQSNARHTPSRRSCSLFSGIGILRFTMGEIASTLEPLETAAALAHRLDNPRHLVGAYTNLAHKHGWIGNYQKQRELASRALSGALAASASVHNTITATLEYALAAYILGDHTAVRRAMEEQRFRVPSTVSTALQQTWLMVQADILAMLREDHTAVELSARALLLADGQVLARRAAAGTASRAALRVLGCGDRHHAVTARLMLEALFHDRTRLDAMEATEVLAAYVSAAEGALEREHTIRELRDALGALPEAATIRLDALGTPPPPECRRVA